MRSAGIRSVLVTGGAGFIGAAVARRLRAEGLAVRVLDDLSRGRPDRLDGLDVELVVADVRSSRSAREAVEGMDAVVHLAWVRPEGGPHGERVAHDVNVTGTFNMLAAARELGVRAFVYASSAAVYGGKAPFLLHEDVAIHPYGMEGAQKIASEAYVRHHATLGGGMAATILRLFSVYGPDQEDGLVARLVGAALAGEPATIYGDGSQTRDLVYVEDVAVAIAATLTSANAGGRTINIASGEAVAVHTVAAFVSDLVGGTPHARYLPATPGEPRDLRASVAASASMLGFRAKVRLREGLACCLGLMQLPLPPLPPRIFPEASDTRMRSPQSVPLFAEQQPSWAVEDDVSFQIVDESMQEWAP